MFRDYSILALNNLKKRGIRSVLTLIGIIVGIATVVSLISLGDGLQQAILSQFGISATEVITIQAGGISMSGPPGTGVVNPLKEADVLAISKINQVEASISRHIETVKIEFNDKLAIGIAGDIPRGKNRDIIYDILQISALNGKLLEDGDSNRVVLGYNFNQKDKNDFDKSIIVGNRIKINGKSYQVKGILEKKGSFIFDNMILINEETLSQITNYGDTVDIIAVKVKGKEHIERIKESIGDLMRRRRGVSKGEEDFEVSTPEASLQEVNQILGGVKIFIVMIAAISIIVGSIGIVNTMTTSVLERVREIGIMKAIGAKNKDIFYQFFIESGLLGMLGGIVGIIIGTMTGYFGTKIINSFLGVETSPDISFELIIATLGGSFFLGAISGIIPAWKASKLKPVEALRK